MFWPEVPTMTKWGYMLWYTTMGAFIGVFGVFTWHPILKSPMPWWFRAPWIGAWMNFILTLFIYNDLQIMMSNVFATNSIFSSPFWLTAEGAIVGLIMGYLALL